MKLLKSQYDEATKLLKIPKELFCVKTRDYNIAIDVPIINQLEEVKFKLLTMFSDKNVQVFQLVERCEYLIDGLKLGTQELIDQMTLEQKFQRFDLMKCDDVTCMEIKSEIYNYYNYNIQNGLIR